MKGKWQDLIDGCDNTKKTDQVDKCNGKTTTKKKKADQDP